MSTQAAFSIGLEVTLFYRHIVAPKREVRSGAMLTYYGA